MDKLQFSSFYKFVVSIGVVLIIVPAWGFHNLLTGSYDVRMSEQEYIALSQVSLDSLRYRKEFMDIFFSCPPCTFLVVFLFSTLPGLWCILWGAYKWYNKVQKELDENLSLNVRGKRHNFEKLTLSANTERILKKDDEHMLSDDGTDSTKPDQNVNAEPRTKRVALNYIKIEDACLNYLNEKLSRHYKIQRGVKVGGRVCDIVAISKQDNVDLVYEIKYWSSAPSDSAIFETLSNLNQFGADYKVNTDRNIQIKLLIVSGKEQLNSIKKKMKIHVEAFPFVEVQYLSEYELHHVRAMNNDESWRGGARKMQCSNNMKMIMLALHNYVDQDARSSLPPLYTIDKDGKPLHSWRVLMLPYLEQQNLYITIRLDEPWDSDYNKQFHDQIPAVYQCPSNRGRGKGCCYSAIAGEVFIPASKEGQKTGRSFTVPGGTMNQIAIVEVKEPFCWMNPTADVDLEELEKWLNGEGRCGSFHANDILLAGFCDGSVRSIPRTTSKKDLLNFGKWGR